MNSPQKTSRSRPLLKRLAKVIAAAITGILLFSVTIFYIMPLSMIEDRAKEYARPMGVSVSNSPLQRAFPFGFKIDEATVYSGGSPLIRLERLRIDLRPLSLFTGRLKAHVEGGIGQGEVFGDVTKKTGSTLFEIEGRGVRFSDLPLISSYGLKAEGRFDSNLVVSKPVSGCPRGFFKVISEEMKAGELKLFGFPLPVGDIDDAGVSVRFDNCSVNIDGVWLEGDDISVRLKGDASIKTPLSSSPLSASLEIIPRGELLKKEYLLGLIQPYKKSANYYQIPISGTLQSPSFGR